MYECPKNRPGDEDSGRVAFFNEVRGTAYPGLNKFGYFCFFK